MRALFAALEAVVLVWALTAAAFTMAYAATASSPHLGAATWHSAVGLATSTFLLGFGSSIPTDIGTLTLVPTLLAGLSALLCAAGQKYLAVTGFRFVPFTALGGLLGVGLIGIFAGRGLGAFPAGVIAAVVCALAALSVSGPYPSRDGSAKRRRSGRLAQLMPTWFSTAAARALRLSMWLTIIALIAFIAAAITAWGRIHTLAGQLSSSVLDTVALWLAQLAYLPSLVVWTLGYLTGAGYHVGSVTFAPELVPDGVLPSIPVLLAGPMTAWSAWVVAAPCLISGVLALRDTRSPSARALTSHLAGAAITAAMMVGVLTLAAWVTGGGVQPGPLAHCGVRPLEMLLAAVLTVALPYLAISALSHPDTIAWVGAQLQAQRAKRATGRSADAESPEQNPDNTAADPAT